MPHALFSPRSRRNGGTNIPAAKRTPPSSSASSQGLRLHSQQQPQPPAAPKQLCAMAVSTPTIMGTAVARSPSTERSPRTSPPPAAPSPSIPETHLTRSSTLTILLRRTPSLNNHPTTLPAPTPPPTPPSPSQEGRRYFRMVERRTFAAWSCKASLQTVEAEGGEAAILGVSVRLGLSDSCPTFRVGQG